MTLNTAHVQGGGVLIFNTERILIYYDGVEMGFEMQNGLPHFKGKKNGRIYLTTHRVIFTNKDAKDTLQSFSMPFFTMKELELEQPVFGANYIKGKVKAESGGNWEGEGRFKMWFNKGGAIEFGQAMLHAGKLASRYAPPQPPVYSPPTAGYYMAPPPAYAPPTGPAYAFVPYQTFPSAPPANSVYMYEAPPPYPGIDPSLTPYSATGPPPAYIGGAYGASAPPPPSGAYAASAPSAHGGAYGASAPPDQQAPVFTNGYHGGPSGGAGAYAPPGSAAAVKEAEAMASAGGSAYYNPTNPHNVYMPPGPMENGGGAAFAPPPYSEAVKKSN